MFSPPRAVKRHRLFVYTSAPQSWSRNLSNAMYKSSRFSAGHSTFKSGQPRRLPYNYNIIRRRCNILLRDTTVYYTANDLIWIRTYFFRLYTNERKPSMQNYALYLYILYIITIVSVLLRIRYKHYHTNIN